MNQPNTTRELFRTKEISKRKIWNLKPNWNLTHPRILIIQYMSYLFVYVYVFNGIDFYDSPVNLSGNITLIREWYED